jgi:hypothetical protein
MVVLEKSRRVAVMGTLSAAGVVRKVGGMGMGTERYLVRNGWEGLMRGWGGGLAGAGVMAEVSSERSLLSILVVGLG